MASFNLTIVAAAMGGLLEKPYLDLDLYRQPDYYLTSFIIIDFPIQ